MTVSPTMNKGEREDLVRLVKQREKVAKSIAEQRSAAMLAEFERQISASHGFATNDVWRAATEAAGAAVKDAMEKIEAEAIKLGIPKEFRPRVSFTWVERGENSYRQRRDELRKVALAEIATVEKMARSQIEAASVRAQTEIITSGLTSDAALSFLNSLPAIESMMPELDPATIQAKLAERARNAQTGFYLVPP